jgi:hypothetical protein
VKELKRGRAAAIRRWWDSMGIAESDRAVYLSIAELSRRHAEVGPEPAAPAGHLQLGPYEMRGFSQNGEDGVIAEILRRTGVRERFFVEFGVETGREGNSVFLADVLGWQGLFIEGDADMFRELSAKYAGQHAIRTVHSLVTPGNVESLFTSAGVPPEPDVLTIDIDGQDYWVWQALGTFRPRVVVIEYNAELGCDRALVQLPDASGWDGSAYFGASIGAMRALAWEKGYVLVHTELTGINAFFVRKDLLGDRFAPEVQVSLRPRPNYFLSDFRHPRPQAGRYYRDLETGQLVSHAEAVADGLP